MIPNAKIAHSVFKIHFPALEAIDCYEYSSVYVFQAAKPGTPVDVAKKAFNNLFFVDKQTSVVKVFQPFHISKEEYRAGKRIPKFK